MAWVKERQRKDGSVYFCVYFRDAGKQTSLSYDDPLQAEHCRKLIDQVGPEKAKEILRIVQSPRHAKTLAQFLTEHVDGLTGVEPGTVKRYRAYIRNDLDDIGAIPLSALTRVDIARWITAMDEDGASGKTIANKHGFLAGALNAAARDGKIKTNPCDGNRLPRWDREEMVFLTRDEFGILNESVPEYWRPLVRFLVASGCRWSEATALKPSDIDVAAGTVRVTKAWKTGSGGYKLGVPKTKKSVRTIDVDSSLLRDLTLTGAWVFTNSGVGKGKFSDGVTRDDDSPVRTHSFSPNVWVPAVNRAIEAGLPKKPRIHDLRHTCASWLIQAGIPLPVIQQHLGHESITTTVNTYGHLDRQSGRQAAAAIGQLLS